VFIAGYSDSFEPNGDFILLSFSPEGQRGLERGFGAAEHESVLDMDIDEQDRIFLAASAVGYSAFDDGLLCAFNIWGNPIMQRRLTLESGDTTTEAVASLAGRVAVGGSSGGREGNWVPFGGTGYPVTGTPGIPAGGIATPSPTQMHPGSTIADVAVFIEDAPDGTDALAISAPLD
jgi:hypothetical protein